MKAEVGPHVERMGVDVSEHGMWGYPELYVPVPGGYGIGHHGPHAVTPPRPAPPVGARDRGRRLTPGLGDPPRGSPRLT